MNKQRKAVYAGTFDPITNGHLDIVRRALNVFENVIVAVADNPMKKSLFSLEQRVSLVSEAVSTLDDVERCDVSGFSGLLVDHVIDQGAGIIIRGLRAVSDYEYEAQMALINRHLSSNLETVFFVTSDNCLSLIHI